MRKFRNKELLEKWKVWGLLNKRLAQFLFQIRNKSNLSSFHLLEEV